MSYNLNVPQASQSISSTTTPINQNFVTANSNFGVDHVDFTNSAPPGGNGGRHNWVSFVQQTGAPPDPPAVNNVNFLYEKLSSGLNELFLERASNDGGAIIQMTKGIPYNTGTPGTEVSTFLPGGLIMKAGNRDITQVTPMNHWNNATIAFNTPFPNNIYSLVISMQRGTTTPHSYYIKPGASYNTSGFQLITDDDTNWNLLLFFAIGN